MILKINKINGEVFKIQKSVADILKVEEVNDLC